VPQIGLFGSIADALYWIQPAASAGIQIHHTEGFDRMTYLDVVYSYGSQPGEAELRAIDSMREVYGIQRVRFDSKEHTVRVQFDASRMKQDAVAKLLRTAGIDVKTQIALA
jgi:hypothetical protein